HTAPPLRASFAFGAKRIVSDGYDAIKIWDTETAELLASIFVMPDGEWLEITPEGFFDASAAGAQILSVVEGLRSYSIDQFFQSLYRPDLVHEKLEGDPRGLVREAASHLDLYKVIASGSAPDVRLNLAAGALGSPGSSSENGVLVTAEIADSGGGIGRVE